MYELLISRGYVRGFPQSIPSEALSEVSAASIAFIFMDQLFPRLVDDVDPAVLYSSVQRQSDGARPWILTNMITSIDGAIDIDGISGPLGGPADKRVFRAIRAIPDVILVGAGTVIAENYRRAQTPPEIQELRVERGQRAVPRIAIVSGSLSIPLDHRVFDSSEPPMVITHAQSPITRRTKLAEVADVIVSGEDHVDLGSALEGLGDAGAQIVLLEGGPTLNAAMIAKDLVDEMCVSVAPHVVGGTGARLTAGTHTATPRNMRLVQVLHQDGYLFCRYLRDA